MFFKQFSYLLLGVGESWNWKFTRDVLLLCLTKVCFSKARLTCMSFLKRIQMYVLAALLPHQYKYLIYKYCTSMTNFSPSTPGYVINGVPLYHNPWVTNDTYMYFLLQMIKNITWSYSEDPGYSGHPKNNSAITHPRDHISIASENGKPRITSGALKKKDTKCYGWYMNIPRNYSNAPHGTWNYKGGRGVRGGGIGGLKNGG